MSQDMTPFHSASSGAGDFWTGSAGTALAPSGLAPAAASMSGPMGESGRPRMSALKRMHRLLRGRYPLAIMLAAAGAAAGATAAFLATPPRYTSEGLINYNPVILTPNPNDPLVPMASAVLASQTSTIMSMPVAEAAVADPDFAAAYAKAYPGADRMDAATFLAGLDAERVRDGFNIKVTYSDKNKDVAQAGAVAAIKAYMSLYGDAQATERAQKLAYNKKVLVQLNQDLDQREADLGKLSAEYGPDIPAVQGPAVSELTGLQHELDDAAMAYKQATDPSGKAQYNNSNRAFVIQQIAAIDPGMHVLLVDRQALEDHFEQVQQEGALPRSQQYQAAAQAVFQKDREIDDYARNFLLVEPGRVPFVVGGNNESANVNLLKAHLEQLQEAFDRQQQKVAALATLHTQMDQVARKIEELQTEIKDAQDRIKTYQAENELAKNVVVLSPGAEALASSSRRPVAAAAGFMFGGALPLGLMMLYGMGDSRFRYSDEATAADLQGVTLLGILPNLPDRLSDPQQAGVAAHCVHQIRTMLQINRSNDEPQVLAVTSAAPGDGKTSLTLALGLSYAACGARTLLIDCDLVAAGLSHRLNVSSPEGVLEAVANRALLEYVRTTDIADVAILPVGITHAHHASTLSPVALRRLLSEAKKNFDIILVDTGPILGSIEASLVCAAADRTILAVARGQQRPLVERSIGHLQAIGSRLAGVVFNRAQSRDFEKSMGGLALRSRPITGNGAAVGASFKRA